ncbi:hypothetical protein [Streptomyces sp. CB03911]|uniref:hypothetical protein n=1 Tax=Streptomyces sp. CB03911 TaxID=1804758 RepID=UPI00093FD44E|nr:hypothetical protein [Streptomyces sp. CB03911]OKI16553.1 hypothetical protein A6A07_11120 [Streptomyces sp. CB03911]
MTTTPPDVVHLTHGGTRWHANADCQALDSGRLLWDSAEGGGAYAVREVPFRNATDLGRTPCLVCAVPPATEWTVTPDNLGELLEIVDPSKVHYAPAGPGRYVSVEADGLTVMAHKGLARTWARFGDTIRRERGGRYTVQHATALEG